MGPRASASGSCRSTTALGQTYVEQFTTTVAPNRLYVLHLVNGAPDGTHRASKVTVELNGFEIVSQTEVTQAVGQLDRVVAVTAVDTILINVAGSGDPYIALSVLSISSSEFDLYGPNQYSVTSGSSTPYDETFPKAATAGTPYRVYVVNGASDGTGRVTTASVTLNSTTIVSTAELTNEVGSLTKEVSLLSSNSLQVVVNGAVNSYVTVRFTATDTTSPGLTITTPAPNALINQTSVAVTGAISDQTATTVTVNGVTATVTNNTSYAATVPLASEGNNLLTVRATDGGGRSTDSTRTVIRDTQAPSLSLTAPVDGSATSGTSVTVSGTASDANGVTVNTNGTPFTIGGGGSFSGSVALSTGVNVLVTTATDGAGNATTDTRTVTQDAVAPMLTVSTPAEGATTTSDSILVSGTVSDATSVTVTAKGITLPVTSGAFSRNVPVLPGTDTILVVATDAAANQTTVSRTVTRSPPDPATVAPPLDRTVATTMVAATSFLYTGANPIQTGVTSGTIAPTRIAVLRGKVITRDGQPIVGAAVTVLGRPEFGSTYTRLDGVYDLAVNGGQQLILSFVKAGFLPAQRSVSPPQQDYTPLADVALIPNDTVATAVTLPGSTVQVAQGSVSSDTSGSRRATVLFKPGTTATMTLPDGSTQPLSTLTVRATEYTVGPRGPEAMPGGLPRNSGYTYAVELSVDQAQAVGATDVQFSQAVPVYVDNFLGFPVGMAVPAGSYDLKKAEWVPSANGRVLKILGVTGGMADLDITGDGLADDSAALAGIGIDRPEREQLATLYASGKTLWRVPVTHFSPWDNNWAYDIREFVNTLKRFWKGLRKCPSPTGGSVIYCESQVLGEDIAVAGTPFSLHYQSDRVAVSVEARTLRIRFTDAAVPPGLKRIVLEVYVAGRTIKTSYQPAPSLVASVTWDGLDAYGRPVIGTQPVRVRIGYVYDTPYQSPAPFPFSFAQFSGTSTTITARQEWVSWEEESTTIGSWDGASFGLGGWSLSDLHAYDPVGRVLVQGDGRTREAHDQSRIITTVVGTGVGGFSGDGGPATAAKIGWVSGLAVGPDGSLYISDAGNNRIRQVSPSGIITTVAGTGGSGYTGDGGPALQAQIGRPERLSVARDGSILFGVFNQARIRKVDPAGIITTVAGTGTAGWSGDGGPATAAKISQYPRAAVFDPDGGFYSLDHYNWRAVRRVSTDSIIRTIAGTGSASYNGDSIPAVNARLCNPEDLALGPDGSVYVEDGCNGRVRRIRPDGIIETVLGTGTGGFSGDGGPATQAQITSGGIEVAPDGSLYLADRYNHRVRRVGPDGIVNTIAGTGTQAFTGDNGPGTLAALREPLDVALASDGSLYIADAYNNRIRRLSPPLPGFAAADIAIASDDGSQLYQVDQYGRHLRTRDALTGAVLLSFGYDSAGRVVTITDADSNVTTVQRNAQGQPTAIIGPFGQQTTLALDGAGYLASVLDPAGNRVRLFHQASGLLDSLTDARGGVHRFTYDSLGRLRRDDAPAGFYQTLALTESDTSGTVSVATTMGRTTAYGVWGLSTGSTRRVVTDPAGFATTSVIDLAGRTTIALPTGDSVRTVSRPDPRWTMQAPNLDSIKVRVPSGATVTVNARRKVTLADPNDPLSITAQYDTSWVAGLRYARTAIKSGTTWLVTSTTPVNRQSFARLDSLGRPIMARVPGLDSVTLRYDGDGRLDRVQNGGRTDTYSYDPQGRLKTTTDPLGRTDSLFYDLADRLTRTRRWDGRQVQFGYDSAGNLTSLTPPGRPAHTFTHRSDDLAQSYVPPSLGSGTWATSYGYNLDGQLTAVARPTGDSVLLSYDPTNGRPTGVSFSRGTLGSGSLTYGYSATTGALTSITHSAGSSLAFTHDGMLPMSVTWSGPVAGTVAVGYDASFRIDTIQVNGSPIALGYDNDGLLRTAGALKLARRTDNGLLQADTLGVVTGSWTFDGRASLASYTAKVSGANVYQVSYVRDSLGRVTSATETVQGTTLTRGFTYDSAGRVRDVTEGGVLVRSYGYDANGNRLSLTGPGLSVSGTYDAQDRVLTYGNATYSHDRDGFLSEKVVGTDTTRYVYDALGNLLRVTLPDATAIEYVVDGESRRVGRKVNGVLQQGWLWQSDLAPAAELDSTGAVMSRFVYATRPNVPDYMVKGGVTYRLVLDQLGSVRLVVKTTDGTVAQRIDYDEFGRVTQNTNPGFQPFGFAGGLYDAQTGLVRFGARDYDPVTGQWTAKEPLGFAGGDANLYAYAGNDPVSLVDPTGEVAIPPAVAFVGGCALSAALLSVVEQALGPNNCVDLGQVGLDALTGAGGCALLGGFGWAGLRAVQAFRAARATGNLHHAISKTVWKALQKHPVLRGLYSARDPRFVTRAINKAAHNGWETWHRKLDAEVASWISKNPGATPAQFESYLRNLYNWTMDLMRRFPGGLR